MLLSQLMGEGVKWSFVYRYYLRQELDPTMTSGYPSYFKLHPIPQQDALGHQPGEPFDAKRVTTIRWHPFLVLRQAQDPEQSRGTHGLSHRMALSLSKGQS